MGYFVSVEKNSCLSGHNGPTVVTIRTGSAARSFDFRSSLQVYSLAWKKVDLSRSRDAARSAPSTPHADSGSALI
jgi:hypothetical protein